jgi:protein-S-isoprenylcysteine O-methyltransferase Ste14
MRLLAASAILPAGATLYFFLFWRWFEYWRKNRAAFYSLAFGTFVALGAALYAARRQVFADAVVMPHWAGEVGWALIALTCAFGFVADRQIGIRVRSFTPFFEPNGRIELKTRGAYGVVRHPIYASGIGYQVGVFLVTGDWAVAAAWLIFTLGALWFTRQEEQRLMQLLDDPSEYQRYRERVPALFPRMRRRRRSTP